MAEKDTPSRQPDWVPDDGGKSFTTRIISGKEAGRQPPLPDGKSRSLSLAPAPTYEVNDYVSRVLGGDRAMLAQTITLIESNSVGDIETAQEVLQALLPHSGRALRVGITGVPGAGKSTLIESLGLHLISQSHRVAVLAIDPSSSVSGGSILADKTRMEKLSREDAAFIRPSPTGGKLGGVARKTRESIVVCEAAGYDIVLVETVGTGQSEIAVRSMVDFFLLLLIPGAGDELQGIKKGVVELADGIGINKADGENKTAAEAARAEYNRALHYLTPATEGWRTRAHTLSALTGDGVASLWDVVLHFQQQAADNGALQNRRREQAIEWLHELIGEQLRAYFYGRDDVSRVLMGMEQAVADGDLPASVAAAHVLDLLDKPAPLASP